ncbi:MAG: ATP-binding protein [Clostridiaceae bacterium]
MIKGYKSEVLSLYEQIREEEARALQARKKEIQELYPEIIQLDQEIGRQSLNLSRSILKSPDSEALVSEIKNKIMDLRAKKYELLVSKGYPQDYLNVRYRCSKCKDTGYIGVHPCQCYNKKLIDIYYKNSHLSEAVKKNNFDNWDISLYSTHKSDSEKYSPRKNIENIYQYILKEYIPNFKTHNENLLFYGGPGTGKTFLSDSIAKDLLDQGMLVLYRTSDELIKNFREIKFENNRSLEDLLINCDLLIIDDLGAEQITEFTVTEIFNLLNAKLLKNKKMLISTNLSLIDLAKSYTERISSRLIGNFRLFKFYGDDIRVKLNLLKNR